MKPVLWAAAFVALCGTANAAPPCFSSEEIEAEQAMLFQTELMVIADSCKDPAYTNFVFRNRASVIAFQKRMIEHFRRQGERKPEDAFDSYLTRLANESALRNGSVGITEACLRGMGLIVTSKGLNDTEFRAYAAEKARLNQAKYQVCR